MNWKKLLESSAETANHELRLRHEYLLAENRILRNQINGRVKLTDNERRELAELGAKLGKKALADIATVAQADTILAWHRKFANQKVDTSEPPKSVGRPRVDREIEEWVIRMARENRSWGYDRIQGSLKHLGYKISDQTVGNILKRHGIPPAPERKKTVTWREFIRCHWDVLMATGFFNCEVWSWFGQMISLLLSFIHFSRHRVQSVIITLHQQILAMKAPVRRFLDLYLHMRRWTHIVARRLQARVMDKTIPGMMESKIVLADRRHMRSQGMNQVADLSSGHHRQIRDGPRRQPPRRDRPWKADDREAA